MTNQVNLASKGTAWRRLFSTNVAAADAAFVSGGIAGKANGSPFAAAANIGIISLNDIPTSERPDFAAGSEEPNSIMLRFFGEDGSNDSFSARVWGITRGKGVVGSTPTQSWEAVLLAQFLITLGNVTGVTGTLIEPTTSFEADTIALTYGAVQDIVINSPANDLRGAYARIDNLAFPILAVEFDESVNAGTAAAACNALYRVLW